MFLKTFSSAMIIFIASLSAEGIQGHSIASMLTVPSAETETVMFTPPANWRFADQKQLSQNVKVMVIGQGEYEYPPSINLALETFPGTLKDYLKIVKSLNEAQGSAWKDLGKIKTKAGNASLSQVDISTEWGTVRMMHVILVKSGTAYILTTASMKEEFPKFYKDFFAAMRSLHVEKK